MLVLLVKMFEAPYSERTIDSEMMYSLPVKCPVNSPIEVMVVYSNASINLRENILDFKGI